MSKMKLLIETFNLKVRLIWSHYLLSIIYHVNQPEQRRQYNSILYKQYKPWPEITLPGFSWYAPIVTMPQDKSWLFRKYMFIRADQFAEVQGSFPANRPILSPFIKTGHSTGRWYMNVYFLESNNTF